MAVLPPATLTDEHVRAVAREIVSQDPYAAWRGHDVVVPVLQRFVEWLERWQSWVDELAFGYQVLIIGGMLLVSVLLLTHVVWSIAAALRARAPERAPRPDRGGPQFAAEAEALAAQGRFLEAAHRLQLATIELLVGQGRLALSRFEANRVLRRRVREATLPLAERRALLELVDRLERGWFRDRAGDADLYGAWRTLHTRLAAGGVDA